KAIATCFSVAGWPTVAVDDIHRWVWRKLAVNAAINPLTALAGVPNRAISRDAGLRAAAATLAAEVVAVANARGVAIDTAEVVAAVEEVARATGDNRSSMLIDLEHGLRTEIDAINGVVVAEASRRGLKAPANQLMTALIRARERREALSAPALDADED
ncbi:MAG: 2-dehydropantoate 2-reductase, partial [Chloroflexia bacterium]|nr:2-dehydropantoate 2-reductase [Chloroflexia bacterium]